MNIKEIEERSGLTRANIRYYEQEGLLAPARRENKYRDYSEEDLETLLRIALLFILPASDPAPRRFPGMLAVSSVSAPFAPLAVTRVSGDESVAVAAAPSQSGKWTPEARASIFSGPRARSR